MDEVNIVGQVIGGDFGDIVIREKSGKNLEIGDLLVSEESDVIKRNLLKKAGNVFGIVTVFDFETCARALILAKT